MRSGEWQNRRKAYQISSPDKLVSTFGPSFERQTVVQNFVVNSAKCDVKANRRLSFGGNNIVSKRRPLAKGLFLAHRVRVR